MALINKMSILQLKYKVRAVYPETRDLQNFFLTGYDCLLYKQDRAIIHEQFNLYKAPAKSKPSALAGPK